MSIPQHTLGKTGLTVSAFSLGTVALAVDYGIQDGSIRPTRKNAIALIQAAAESGITLFDTAPNYGDAESLIGEALIRYPQAIIATKVSLPENAAEMDEVRLSNALRTSVDKSRQALQRDTLDILQVHNLTANQAASERIGDILRSLKDHGLVRHLGASVYTEDEAMTSLQSGWVEVLQVAYNLLDQRMSARVFDGAKAAGVGVLTRSAFLKGALTPRANHLPPSLAALKIAVEKLAGSLAVSLDDLPKAAIAFCVSEPRIASVLIGPSTIDELESALRPLDVGMLNTTREIGIRHALNNPTLVDPRMWPIS